MPSQTISTPFGEARVVPTQVFASEILPPLRPELDLEEFIHEQLPELPVTQNDRLWGYKTKTPSQVKGRKSAAFRSLRLCARKLARAVESLEPNLEPNLDFLNNEASEWNLDKREETSLPDAYLVSKDTTRGHPISWKSIAIPGVYAKNGSHSHSAQNIIKLTRCMAQCMYHDPRRRFMYGFCIEDSSMTLWYCDRTQLIASKTFNFVQDWRTFLRFLLSAMYAEEQELGFDPTITPCELPDGTTQYDIVVRSESGEEYVYRTLELISITDISHTVGRGTRVWKAISLEDGIATREPVALKDCWVDHDRQREGLINSRIRESAESETQEKILGLSLLTVLCHGDVLVSGRLDRTRAGSTAVFDTKTRERSPSSTPKCKVHYRIVYKEIGSDLSEVTSLATVFKALKDVTYGLMAMHESGWTHGDVNPGNILLYGDWAKISDLEYATHESERVEHDRVGTAYFSSVEVKHHTYVFQPPIGDSRTRNVIFRYNPLHDLESLWWIAASFLITTCVVNAGGDAQTRDQLDAQRRAAYHLFWAGDRRRITMATADDFARQISHLHPSLELVALNVEDVRQRLVYTFRQAEQAIDKIPSDFDITERLHWEMAQRFGTVASDLKQNDIEIRPLYLKPACSSANVATSRKRPTALAVM